jgi:hypothetical protein
LHRKIPIHHSQLSQFRTDLTIAQMINLMVYAAHLLLQKIKLPQPVQICGVDSSDLASSCGPVPLATLTMGHKKVRIYSELDADCGKRRKKRNKSEYFVGYRLHTLVVLDPQNGHHYPLLSMVAPEGEASETVALGCLSSPGLSCFEFPSGCRNVLWESHMLG